MALLGWCVVVERHVRINLGALCYELFQQLLPCFAGEREGSVAHIHHEWVRPMCSMSACVPACLPFCQPACLSVSLSAPEVHRKKYTGVQVADSNGADADAPYAFQPAYRRPLDPTNPHPEPCYSRLLTQHSETDAHDEPHQEVHHWEVSIEKEKGRQVGRNGLPALPARHGYALTDFRDKQCNPAQGQKLHELRFIAPLCLDNDQAVLVI